MNATEAIDLVFGVTWASSLKSSITGAVRRYSRPLNSDKEDIVINILTTDFDQLQNGIINLNVFVPNPHYTISIDGKSVVVKDIPNQSRISSLTNSCASIFKQIYDKDKHALIELVNQIIIPEQEQTIINNRIKLTIKNL